MHFRISLRSIAVANAILLAASWAPFPVLSGFVAALGLITLPTMVGFTVWRLFIKLRRRSAVLGLTLRCSFTSWAIGLITVTLSASLVSIFLAPVAFDVAGLVSLLGLGSCIVWGASVESPEVSLTPASLASVGALVLGAFVPFWYLRSLAPFPLMLGQDFFDHLVQIGTTLDGISGIHLSDDGFITTLASSSLLAHAQPLWTFWVGPAFQYLALSLGIYYLAGRVIRNNWVCLACALLPLWFMGDGLVNDLIYLLRPNIVLCMLPFAVAIAIPKEDYDSEIRLAPIAISAIAALFFWLDVSVFVFESFTARLASPLQYLIQPGFVITAPAYVYGLPADVVQDLYAAALSSLLFLVALRLSSPHEKRLLSWWYLVTCAGVLIEYRIGMLLSLMLLGVFVLRRHPKPSIPSLLGLLGLGAVGILMTGGQTFYRIFLDAFSPLSSALPGVTDDLIGTTIQSRLAFLTQDFGVFFLSLTLLSLAFLLIAWRGEPAVRRMAYVAVLGVFMYFTPFPDSQFFLILFAPFVGIMICLAMMRLYSCVDSRGGKVNHGSGSAVSSARSGKYGRASPAKAIFAIAACILLIVGASNITQSYDYNITGFRDTFGANGSVTSFTPQDVSVAAWLKSNFPATTLIISDPVTILILAGLAELPYTTEGISYAGATAMSNVTLFMSVVTNLSPQALDQLVAQYRVSDKYFGFDSSNLRVVLVVNERTTWWVNGEQSYDYANTFMNFPGLAAYPHSSLITPAFNASASYKVYNVIVPQGT